jgi:N-acetylglucosamine kinase-like BadF-type ATPase
MEFISIHEFNSSPAKTRKSLKKDGKLVLTNKGKPSMLVLDIVNQDFENLIDILNRAEAMKLLDSIQIQAARGGLAGTTMEEIDAEIAASRKEKKGRK